MRGKFPRPTHFVLMGKALPKQVIERLQSLLGRMGLTINADKTRQIDARQESFNFVGFTVRYARDLWGKNTKYWYIMPSKKSENKLRGKIKEYLDTHGHYKAEEIANGINAITRGWLNNVEIEGVCYPAMSKRRLRYYLSTSLYRYFNRKSQRKSRLYGQKAFEVLVSKYGMIDPTKYSYT